MLKAGIVGLPNVGKSTLFNALTRSRKAEAANYPFCTIDPNVGVVVVPDERAYVLQTIAKTKVVVPAAIEFVDIAGLVAGASKGEGLGNQFLATIREVDAIVQVVRCFEDNDIIHTMGGVDPVRDIEVITTELILADLDAVTKRIDKTQKKAKSGDKEAIAEIALLEKLSPHLNSGKTANTFAATTTPAGVGGLALSTRFLQKAGLGTVRATAAVAVQQAVQVITHVALLIFFSVVAGASADLSHFVPKLTLVYLIAGVALGVLGAFLFVPTLRIWLDTAIRPKLAEVGGELIELVRDPKRFAIIVLGCAGTTLGAALALWASVEAFGGGTTFVTVTVVTMVGGTLASAAPTPGGVGAVEAALIGGLAAFGVPTAVAVPSVLLYRVLTCWLPVFAGWPIMRWLTARDMI